MTAPRDATAPGTLRAERAAAYRLIAEWFLYPDDRQPASIDAWRRALNQASPEVRAPLDRFARNPRSSDCDEYLSVLELAPPCPLYLGAYLYEEPSTCRGAGTSQRNSYMMEVQAAYHHFGLDLGAGELADFLPAMLEFLAITFDADPAADDGVRDRFLDLGVRRALPEMHAALVRHESPYANLIEALQAVVEDDLADRVVRRPPTLDECPAATLEVPS